MDQDYSIEEKFENYQFVLNTIQDLENKNCDDDSGDWIEFHMDKIRMYRAWIPNFSLINDENFNYEFRRVASKTERILDTIIYHMTEECTLDLDLYLEFNKCLLYLTDASYELQDDDIFANMFAGMNVTETNENKLCMEE